MIWRHNDVAHLEELPAAQPPERTKLIVLEASTQWTATSRS
jgi:5-aminolevulinate synthase